MPTKNGRATIADVARAAGVSITTVSRVINGKGDVSPRARDAVLEAMAATSYEASPVARSLVGGRTRLIGLHALHPTHEYSAAMIPGVLDVCERAGYGVLWSAAHFGSRNRVVPPLGSLTDGLLIIAPTMDAEADMAVAAGRPLVVVEPWREHADQASVNTTHRDGATAATCYLLDLGHRRIGYVTGRLELASGRERLDGFRAAMGAAGISPDPDLIVEGRNSQESGLIAARQLLALNPRPTAIFASNDAEALGVVWAARDAGLAIPADLSVIGFDDIPLAAHLQPPLTTIRQPLYELGQRASEMLIGWIEGTPPKPNRVVLPTELVVRSSCAPPKGAAIPG